MIPRLSRYSVAFSKSLLHQRSGLFRCFATIPFNLTDIGEGITEVEIMKWMVKPGQKISQFDPIAEVQSDKATVTISSRFDGTVTKLEYKQGDTAQVGKPLIYMDTASGEASTAATSSEKPAAPASAESSKPSTSSCSYNKASTASENKTGKVLATPAVRAIARHNKIDLTKVTPTGKGGRIMKEDVMNYMNNKQPQQTSTQTSTQASSSSSSSASSSIGSTPNIISGKDRVEKISGIRKMMTKSMTESLSIPHLGYNEEVEMNELTKIRKGLKEWSKQHNVKISYMPFIVKAASMALNEFPIVNSSINKECTEIIYHPYHNIGIAMDTPRGLIVPCVKNCEQKSIVDIAKDINNLQTLGSQNKLGPNELSNVTFTYFIICYFLLNSLSNIGTIGGTYAFPLITPPQVAIIALGKIQKLPRFDKEGKVISKEIMDISVSADHRIIDGATIARFFQSMKGYMENPMSLLTLLR